MGVFLLARYPCTTPSTTRHLGSRCSPLPFGASSWILPWNQTFPCPRPPQPKLLRQSSTVSSQSRRFQAAPEPSIDLDRTFQTSREASRPCGGSGAGWRCRGWFACARAAAPGRIRRPAFTFRSSRFGFRVSVFAFRVSVFAFRFSRFGFRFQGFGFQALDLALVGFSGFRVPSLRSGVNGLGFGVWGLGFGVWGLEFWA